MFLAINKQGQRLLLPLLVFKVFESDDECEGERCGLFWR